MKYLIYETPMASEEDLLSPVDDGGLRVVYQPQNIVRKYHICVDVGYRRIKPFL